MEIMEKKHWHRLSLEAVLDQLGSDQERGLTEAEAGKRQKFFGRNLLPEEPALPWLRIFFGQMRSPLIYILIIAGIITVVFRAYTDAAVIFGAVLVNSLFGFFEENKVSKTLKELKKIVKTKAVILREGQKREVFQEEIVPGDIIILRPGDRVPADARLLEASNLKINEAVLTGEWVSAQKTVGVLPKETPLADRDNMVYLGTAVEEGEGQAVATEIGAKTEAGKIAFLVKETKEEKTPLQKKLVNLARIIGVIIVSISLFIFIGGVLRQESWPKMFETAVAVAVAGIPESLPVVMTVILAIGMERLLRRKGLVRRLASVETLGSTSVICSDKTKTLTKGEMVLDQVFTLAEKEKERALEISVLANSAFIENPKDPYPLWRVRGSPTDRALILGAANLKVQKPRVEQERKKLYEIPFNAQDKFIAAFYGELDGAFSLYVSGAPEKILELSELKEEKSEFLKKQLDEMAESGLRIIGVAYKKIQKSDFKAENLKNEVQGLVFGGFLGLKDPLREEVKRAVLLAMRAGIRTVIVTGDHKKTARAVARELGIKVSEKNIMEGKDLEALGEEEFQRRIKEISVFARVEPAHKLRIIDAWQKQEEVVAMIGDGVNDAPALKKADIGVAVGSGTEVAKATSDLILLDDSFNTVVKAIEQGRVILDNIRKSIAYILSDSFTEVLLVGFSIILGWPLPMLPVHILWNNFVEDALPTVAYAFEPKEEDVMKRGPNPRKAQLLTKEMKILIFFTGIIDDFLVLALFWLLWQHLGMGLEYARTMVFGAIAIDTAFVAFSYKNFKKNIWQINLFNNKFLILSSVMVFVAFALAIYLPPLQTLLKTVPLGLGSWLILTLMGITAMLMIELTKFFFIVRAKKEPNP